MKIIKNAKCSSSKNLHNKPTTTNNYWLGKQFRNVRNYLISSYPRWVSLSEIATMLMLSEDQIPSISAKIRTMRSSYGGEYLIDCRYEKAIKKYLYKTTREYSIPHDGGKKR